MRRSLLFAPGLFVIAAIAMSGCSRSYDVPSTPNAAFHNPLAPPAVTEAAPDSIPPGPHPPPPHPGPPPPIPAVVFISADSAFAGDSINTRWQLGTNGRKAITMPWTLTSTRTWPGFPKSGSVALGARSTQLLLVGVLVPDTAAAGDNPLLMTVTKSDGTTASAGGVIQILASGP